MEIESKFLQEIDQDMVEDQEIDILDFVDDELSQDKSIDIEDILDLAPDQDSDIDSIIIDDQLSSNHSINKKHSLNYDSIFKGKKEAPLTEDDYDGIYSSDESFEVDKSSIYWFESMDNETYVKEKRIKERVYVVLSECTDLKFTNNRRKPSRIDFNQYYYLLVTNLRDENFTHIEIFNELSIYFSDNLFNMFTLLDNKWRNIIIQELQDHIGKNIHSKEVKPRNIHIGTEVEFIHKDDLMDPPNDSLLITGVVIDSDYENFFYKIDSYEKVYEVKIESITKILNNTKFRYNLNKLNNIDFL